MNRLVRHIEENLPFELDAGLLSRTGYVSHAKLYRGFYNLTGHSVKEYVRKRRLSNALALIKTSDFDFTDIALQCGYSSHQSLCRAIRQTLDMTPSEYKSGDTYYFFPPFIGEHNYSFEAAHDFIGRLNRFAGYKYSVIEAADKDKNELFKVISCSLHSGRPVLALCYDENQTYKFNRKRRLFIGYDCEKMTLSFNEDGGSNTFFRLV